MKPLRLRAPLTCAKIFPAGERCFTKSETRNPTRLPDGQESETKVGFHSKAKQLSRRQRVFKTFRSPATAGRDFAIRQQANMRVLKNLLPRRSFLSSNSSGRFSCIRNKIGR